MNLKLSQLNIERIQNKQKWLIEKLLVALAKERRPETMELYNKYQETETLIERLRSEFYDQPACIPADFPEKERRKIKDRMWQDWRNRRFQTWQQMIDEALKDCNPIEIIKKQKLVEQWLKAFEHRKDDIDHKSETGLIFQKKIIKGISALKKDINSIVPHAKRGLKVLNSAAQGGRESSKLHDQKRKEIKEALIKYLKGNPYVSLTAARDRIAKQFSVSRRSVERYTRSINKK